MILGLMGACNSNPTQVTSQPEQEVALTRYQTPTTTQVAQQTLFTMQPTDIPLPTATPFLYTVVANDTMLGIALQYSVSLEALSAANPGVDPRFLSVGTDLIIPIGEGNSGLLPSPTPVDVVFEAPSCYPTAPGGLWCFILVGNDQPADLENLSGFIRLYSSEGEVVANQEVNALMNFLPAGRQIPLLTFFTPIVPAWEFAEGSILSAIRVSDGGARYLPGVVEDLIVEIDAQGMHADIRGTVSLSGDTLSASLVWVVAVAYSVDGSVVGVRRWENEPSILVEDAISFEMQVFSLGPTIASVDVLVEARP